uniref:Ig-like domain-containing protein n=1 Tax=Paramormyrops kingsleyae TaxID=1676925 RepID=A0A3B3Q2R2_9TELE
MSAKVDKDNKRVDLELSSTEVTDSAVYYCALSPTSFIKHVCVTVGVDADQIHQPPLIKSPDGDKAVLTCSHDITDSRSMYWYVQHPNEAPELLFSESGRNKPDRRITMDVNNLENKRVDLELSSTEVTDSAVYYCALRPTVTGNSLMLYKNLTALLITVCLMHNIS